MLGDDGVNNGEDGESAFFLKSYVVYLCCFYTVLFYVDGDIESFIH